MAANLSDDPTNIRDAYSVIVVGAGSVGLSLAAELGWRGVGCLLIDVRDGVNPHPRANAVANRTMEYYRRWGVDQAILEAGVPPDAPADYYWMSSFFGRVVHKVSLPPFKKLARARTSGGYAKGEHEWSPYLKTITGQDQVEQVVLDYVRDRPSVDTRLGWRLVDFEQSGETVDCDIENVSTGERRAVRAAYLVGCDGGRSTVREKLGIKLSGRASLARFVSVYFRAPDLMKCHGLGPANIYFPLHRDYRGFILNWDSGTTFTYHVILKDGQDWTSVDPVDAVHRVLGRETPVEVLSVQPWTAHALVADAYRDRRVFLAGDAAHLFTPTGGFGMNTGVSDAIDLAWKLQARLDGWGGERLLDSYFVERHPIGRRNTSEAADCFDRLYGVMQAGDLLDADTPEGEALRARLQADIKDQEKLVVSSGTLLGYRYEGSPIVVPDGTDAPEDHPRRYVPTARPGHRAPHIWLAEGESILDRLGSGFTLLCFGAPAAEAAPLIEAAAGAGVPLTVETVDDPDAAGLYAARFALVRPDLMVAWRADRMPDDPARVIDIVRGA